MERRLLVAVGRDSTVLLYQQFEHIKYLLALYLQLHLSS